MDNFSGLSIADLPSPLAEAIATVPPGLGKRQRTRRQLLLAAVRALRIVHVGTLWDDAYIFLRYANNVLAEGRISWNPRSAPTYGMTTPAFLVVTVPALALFRGAPPLAASLASAIPGFVFLGLLGVFTLLARRKGVRPRVLRRIDAYQSLPATVGMYIALAFTVLLGIFPMWWFGLLQSGMAQVAMK